jgi:type I restriction enzyme S subunit
VSRWPVRPVRDLVVETEKIDPRKTPDLEFQYVDISSVDNKAGAIAGARTLRGSEAPLRARKVIRADDVIVATTRPYLNQVALVPPELDGQVCSTGFCVLRSNGEVDPRFLYRFTRSQRFIDQVAPRMRGSAYPAVSDSDVLDAVMPVPPLEEQRRVVAKLDAALPHLASVVEDAQVGEDGARRIPGSILASVLMAHPDRDSWVSLSAWVASVENGWSPKCLPRPAEDGEWGVLKVSAVSSGTFRASENKALPADLTPCPHLVVRNGDFLCHRANVRELVGIPCLVEDEPPPRLMLSDKIFRFVFRPEVAVDPMFLKHLMQRPEIRAQIEARATGTSSSMLNISKRSMLEIRVPPVPYEIQVRVGSKLRSVEAVLRQVSDLRQGVHSLATAARMALLENAFRH